MSRVCRYADKVCLVCGAVYTPRSSRSRTCSEPCSRELRKQRASARWAATAEARREAMKGCCAVCGREYYRRSKAQKCCSLSCAPRKKALDRRGRAAAEFAPPGSPAYVAMAAAEAERLRRALGFESYGKATAAAMACGQTLSQFLRIEAAAAGIELDKGAKM